MPSPIPYATLAKIKCRAYQGSCRAAKARLLLGWTAVRGYVAYLLGDCEVDEVGSNAHFRQVMWVGQLGGHVQPKIHIIVDVGAPKPNEAAMALTGDSAFQQWQQLRLQAAAHFLHLGSVTSVNIQGVCKCQHLQVLTASCGQQMAASFNIGAS